MLVEYISIKWMWDCVLNFQEPKVEMENIIKKYLHLFP